MNKLNPREWEWTLSEYMDPFIVAFASFFIGGIAFFLTACGLNELLYFVLPEGPADAISITFWLIGWATTIMSWWWLPRINKLWPVQKYLRSTASRYLKLSKQDRKEFPKNFLNTLSDTRLTYDQMRQIDQASDRVFRELRNRDAERVRLAAQSVDIDGILDNLSNARKMIESDVKTYREFG
jgi:hypothetical protein